LGFAAPERCKHTVLVGEPTWHREEIHRGDHFTMVTQKCFPSHASITKPACTSHPARDRSLGDIKSKLQQFTVNPRRTPGRILDDHPENQFAQFPADSPSATADLVAATPAPILGIWISQAPETGSSSQTGRSWLRQPTIPAVLDPVVAHCCLHSFPVRWRKRIPLRLSCRILRLLLRAFPLR